MTATSGQPLPTVAILGAGDRGAVYADALAGGPMPSRIGVVADPDPARRDRLAERHGVPAAQRFTTWEDLLAARPAVDGAIVALPDPLHAPAAHAALGAGWHVMLEKPMASDPAVALRLVRAARAADRHVLVCHVLRYTRFFRAVREVVASGRLGRIAAVTWRENVHRLHFAHSYVRGNWRRRDTSGPLVLTKCSHDLDLLTWILDESVVRVASVGDRTFFRADRAPAGAAERCDRCELASTCAFDATRFYGADAWGWARKAFDPTLDAPARTAALTSSPYGRCVWRSDNDVVDRQSVWMETASGTPVTLTVHGFSAEEGRSLRIDGTRATLRGVFRAHAPRLEIVEAPAPTEAPGRRDPPTTRIDVSDDTTPPYSTVHASSVRASSVHASAVRASAVHGGGDAALAHAFADLLHTGELPPDATTAEASWRSHLLAFAADVARRERRIVDLDAFASEVVARASAAT